MKYGYSRQLQTETRQNIRSAVFYGIATLLAIIAIIFFGIPIMGKVAGFFHDLRSSGEAIVATDTTPPAPPSFKDIPEFTNKTILEVKGGAEAGATVKIAANDEEVEIIANNQGEFNYTWTLWKGENKISGIAKDSAGNESQISALKTVTFDNKPPTLEISSPSDGKQLSGSQNRQTTVKGKTDEGVRLTINDRIVAVETDGAFSFFTSLTDGENKFTIKATDQATNSVEKTLTINFTP